MLSLVQDLRKSNLITLLNHICKRLDIDYNINSGGCCFVAYCIAKELENLGIDFKLRVYGAYEDDFYDIPYSMDHYVIVTSRRIINLGHFQKRRDWKEYNISSEEIFDHYKCGDWNYRYSRRWNLIVQTIIHSKIRKFYDN